MSQKKVCRYGTECYRINPIHLSEMEHPHLDKILVENYNERTKTYKIPDEMFVSRDIVLKQIEIIKTIVLKKTKDDFDANTRQLHVPIPIAKIKDGAQSSSQPLNMMDLDPITRPRHISIPLPSNKNSQNSPSASTSRQSNKTVVQNQKRDAPTSSSSGQASYIAEKKAKISNEDSNTYKNVTSSVKEKELPPIFPSHIRMEDYISVIRPRGQMAKKLKNASPYNFFLTSITDSKPTHSEPLTVTFQELLDNSLGEIESSVQINYLVEIGYLMAQYHFSGNGNKPLLILYGMQSDDLENIGSKRPNITAIKIQMSGAFGIHHTKMMLFGYKDGSMRVIVSTANLYEDDWHNRTEGIWVSPKLEPIPDDSDTDFGESPTGFRESLLKYLIEYKLSNLQPWIARIRKSNFSEINVFFIASVPGGHRTTPKGPNWGHPRLGYVLEKHCAPVPDEAPILTQSSSIGSLGPNLSAWIANEYFCSLRKDTTPIGLRKIPEFKMIYPSFSNVLSSHDKILGGGCLPYSKVTNEKQHWLKNHLYQWKSKGRYRSQAMPHIKSYCRYLNDKLYWFHLTSANLSKAAWGMFNKTGNFERPLRINNYEAGVLFLPKFIIQSDYFPMKNDIGNIPVFPMPYDIPLTKYGLDDIPFQGDL